MKTISILFTTVLSIVVLGCKGTTQKQMIESNETLDYYQEAFRPQYHFSPEEYWMNDPNGLVYHKGVYHLFYQYYPEDIVWGPMHWGHATSADLVHWEHQPIALYPDELGYIFSGSAVFDAANTSGLGSETNPPLIAAYTYHDPKGAEAGTTNFQYQGMAYSLDQGNSWNKYEQNPIIANTTGVKDFRDPKVFWNDQLKEWTMALVVKDHMQLWRSEDLKSWEYMSSFGKDKGAHGGVWECPDLFKLQVEGSDKTKWVVLISINPGAPNGGSGTQYFVGDFDGERFTTDQKESKWIDLGADNYAGVTYNNTPEGERLFIGWMSNWDYAQETPTQEWRSAMTLPRVLKLKSIEGSYVLTSTPVEAISKIVDQAEARTVELTSKTRTELKNEHLSTSKISLSSSGSIKLFLSNTKGEELSIHLSKEEGSIQIDRSNSGLVDFSENYSTKMSADFVVHEQNQLELYVDQSSVELFVNGGERVMTAQVFNTKGFQSLVVENTSDHTIEIEALSISPIRSIWN